jgi:hypothetical protein
VFITPTASNFTSIVAEILTSVRVTRFRLPNGAREFWKIANPDCTPYATLALKLRMLAVRWSLFNGTLFSGIGSKDRFISPSPSL